MLWFIEDSSDIKKGITKGSYLILANLALGILHSRGCMYATIYLFNLIFIYRIGSFTGLKIRQTVLSSIHKKILRLNTSSILWQTTGKIINFATNDLKFFDDSFFFSIYVLIAPFQLLTVYILIARVIGYIAAFVGILPYILTIPIQVIYNLKCIYT